MSIDAYDEKNRKTLHDIPKNKCNYQIVQESLAYVVKYI